MVDTKPDWTLDAVWAAYKEAAKTADATWSDFDWFEKGFAAGMMRVQEIREQLMQSNWQPIDTAPTDGTPVLLFASAKGFSARVPVIGWMLTGHGWAEAAFSPNAPVGITPTHWQPIPRTPRGD